MTEPIKYWNAPRGTTLYACADGELVNREDYERLEQECAHVREERDSFQRVGIRTMEERDAALQLLAQCQEHLDPHRDAVLWGQVVEALRGNQCQHLPITSSFGTWCELCEKKLD